MSYFIGRNREARYSYGFDDVALVPSDVAVDPDDVDISMNIANIKLKIPFLASAMDGVVDVKMAEAFNKVGGLAVLNLDGINTRYENPEEAVNEIVNAPNDKATEVFQKIYKEPIKPKLIAKRVEEIKKRRVYCAVSSVPQNASKFGPIARDAGADIYFVQATVLTKKYYSSKQQPLDLEKFIKMMEIPVVLGNCVTYKVALDFMEVGAAAVMVGVGPGAACTTRGVLGIGVPQITATVDCAAAKEVYYKKTGKYVPIITDGGMITGGDVSKAIAAGADAVMIGSPFAKAIEAPGKGYHWGMATSHENLPRGTRVNVGITGTIEEILLGPAKTDDGTQNLAGALKTSMGSLGVRNIREMQMAQIIIAPSIKAEGKLLQKTQIVGMGRQK
ncbi:MAG: GuaB3 family IMP dehydrogenase-related protein [Elusimicrobiales bacterium]|jgi:IMP dehydrogenase|nr:GuaB3 family IMP dehydrogenase-related protein [Elusimicrobiales bacterium]NLH38456.1 GuaB3 family IMP dehydrogenase-related protein [Elusimicrobiota bacterium]